jgi:hypothetical protein
MRPRTVKQSRTRRSLPLHFWFCGAAIQQFKPMSQLSAVIAILRHIACALTAATPLPQQPRKAGITG